MAYNVVRTEMVITISVGKMVVNGFWLYTFLWNHRVDNVKLFICGFNIHSIGTFPVGIRRVQESYGEGGFAFHGK